MHAFVAEFKLSFGFLSSWQDPVLLEISSDFERCSAVLISRMLIDCFQVYSYPFPNTKYLYVSNYKHSMKEHIRKHARLEIGKATGVQGDEEQVQVVFSIQQAIIFHLYNHALQFGEFSAFSSEQEYYSLKLLHNLHAASKCIISFERCVLTTPAEGLLYVDFSCYRSKDFELKDQQRNEDDSNDLFDIIDAEPVDKSITYPCKGVFLPECEEVVVLSNVRTSWKENLVSSAHSNQQRHGYMQYIPTNKEAFQEYWKYAYGIQLSDDFVDLMEVKTDLDQKVVPGSSVIRAIVEWPRCKEDSVLTIVEKLSNNLVKCSIFQSYDHLYSALETINNHRKRILELKSHDGGRDDREVSSINASNPSNTLFYKASTGRKVSMKLKRDAARPPLETETKKKSRTKGKKKGKGVAFATEIVESLNKENVNVVVNQVTPDTIIDKGNDEDFSNIFETDWL